MKKSLFKTFLISFLAILAFTFFGMTVLSFSSPMYMAEKFDKMGMKTFAYGCYDRVYKNTNDITKMYFMFNRATELDYDSHIVHYSEKMFNEENKYSILILSRNTINQESVSDYIEDNPTLSDFKIIRLKIAMYNEDNYIKNKYISSLLKLGKEYKAIDFAMQDINNSLSNSEYSSYTNFYLTEYISKNYLSPGNLDKLIDFYEEYKDYVETLDGYDDITPNELGANEKNLPIFVCLQRLTEIADSISTVYQKAGNSVAYNEYKDYAEAHKAVIYG